MSSRLPPSLAVTGGIPVKSQDLAASVYIYLAQVDAKRTEDRLMTTDPRILHIHTTRSIVFTIAYFLLLPVAIWRQAIPASRCWTLIRPIIFIALRIGTFIIRAVQANGNYQIGFFVAEQVRSLLASSVFGIQADRLCDGILYTLRDVVWNTFHSLTRSCSSADLSFYASRWLLYWGIISCGIPWCPPSIPHLAVSWVYSE
jgi:hypothetical protein